MEYSPPPLFKQGASARVKVIVFSMIAITLLIADSRLRSLAAIRQTVGVMLYPLQVAALMPRDAAYAVGGYFSTLSRLQNENGALKRQQTFNAQHLQQGQQLMAENAHLRKLLAAGERLPSKPVMAEILYDARDAFTRKVIVDRGARHGVEAGLPIIDDTGVVGQVTRVFPFTSEVTLLTDKDQAIPVQVVRSGLRSVAYGQGHSGTLDLRFMPVNADIKNGDILVTSGIDGVYPAGLAVAKVTQVESKSSDAFARIVCQPLAGIDRNRQLLILLNEKNALAMPNGADEKHGHEKPAGSSAKTGIDTVKHAPMEQPKPVAHAAQPVPPVKATPPAANASPSPAPKQAAGTARPPTAPAISPAQGVTPAAVPPVANGPGQAVAAKGAVEVTNKDGVQPPADQKVTMP
jgi:rod shape-determining protein MreC